MIKMRYDLFICFLISGVLLLSINAISEHYVEKRLEQDKEEKVISAEEIGGVADDTIPVVSSIAEMKEQSRFTVRLEYDWDSNSIYAEDHLWDIIELDSGEVILADVYQPSVQFLENEDRPFYSDELYPVGQLVKKELTQEMIDDVADEGFELSVTDCYIDMANGNNNKYDPTVFQAIMSVLMVVVPVTAFILLHIVGVKIGFFPPIIPRREA